MNPTKSDFSEPIIFHRTAQLYRAAHDRVSRFPKISRHSLGVRIENVVLEILELLYLAHSKRDSSRLLILNKADIKLRILCAHLRLAHATKCTSDAGFAELSTLAVEIGRMIGGWLKETKAQTKARE